MKKTRYKAHHRKNVGGAARRILSFVLVLVTVAATLPLVSPAAYAKEEPSVTESESPGGAAAAEEAEPDKEVPEESPEPETAADRPQEEPESKPDEEADKPEDTAYANRISGMLWLDVLEDKDSGVYPGDGIRQEGEQPFAAYEVSLYKAEDKTTPVETVQTDSEGNYIFEHLEPGSYVVGISTCIKDDTEYLLPVAGITEDNQFADFNEDYTTVYSEELTMEADTVMTEVNAGMRTPPGIIAASVGIQPSKSDLYVRNQTKIGFGGKQWWVIGDSSVGTPASLRSPSAGTVTLFSDRSANFGTSIFKPYTGGAADNNNYNGSTLQSAMTSAYNVLTPKERTYVVPRGSMDLQSYPNQNVYNYVNPTNQNFWPLSVYEYNDMGSGTVVNGIRGDATYVWLRSPYSSHLTYGLVGLPAGSGATNNSRNNVFNAYSVRPAFYFDLSSALFSSVAATGGASDMKSASPGTKNLAKAETPGANTAVKLTMEDDKSNGGRLGMTVSSQADITSHPDGDVSFSYSGASTGSGRSVSVMICNKDDAAADPGKILFYGRPVNCQSVNASGTATFTLPNESDLPIGDYTLKIFNEEVNGDNYTDYASTPIEVGLHVREVEVSLSANPDNSKVYYTDTTPGHVDLTATVKNHLNLTGTTIQNAKWFRVPISDTTDYGAGNAFDTAYASSTVSANKGTIGASSNDDITATFPLQVDKNATYWFQGTVYDPAEDHTYTNVSSITVDNLYKEITCTVSGINDGVSPSSPLYADEPIPANNGTTKYGVPYDLDGTTPLTAPSLNFDTITLSAKTQYIPYGAVTTKSGHVLTTSSNAKVVTLDGNTNAECDSGNFTKYTIRYNIKRYVVTRDSNGAVLGSHDQLITAVGTCLAGVPCTITASADDPVMGAVVVIDSGKKITLTSIDPGSPRTITQTVDSPNGRHILLMDSAATLTLKDITLQGRGLAGSADANGGVEVVDGLFTMKSGAVITKCAAVNGYGGGVELSGSGKCIMDGGTISDNNAGTSGGGVRMKDTAEFTLNAGTITGNNAGTNGGGIWAGGNAVLAMNGGTISANDAGSNGAGVYSRSTNPFAMSGGTITGNTAAAAGGGLFLFGTSALNMSGGEIAGNTAGTEGGGIYTADNSYENPADTNKYNTIHMTGQAQVRGNTATGGIEVPPSNAALFNSRFPGTLLNNNNINYRNPSVDVTIDKTVTGAYGDKNKAFAFTITVQDTNGTPLASGTSLSYTGSAIPGVTAPADQTLTLDGTGSATVTLKHGQSITISGIPKAGHLQVKEAADAHYNTTHQIDSGAAQSGADTGLITMNGTNRTIGFENTSKTVTPAGLSGGMAQKGILLTGAVLCLAGAGYTIFSKVRRKRHE